MCNLRYDYNNCHAFQYVNMPPKLTIPYNVNILPKLTTSYFRMHIALTVFVLLARKVALSEAPPEETTTIQNTSTQLIGILDTLSIAPPVLDPLEDLWIRIDNEIEFKFEQFPSPTPPNWSLDAICREKDERAEAIRIPSSPNIIFSLLEIQQSSETGDPWITNVISLEKGEKARPNIKQCHQ